MHRKIRSLEGLEKITVPAPSCLELGDGGAKRSLTLAELWEGSLPKRDCTPKPGE